MQQQHQQGHNQHHIEIAAGSIQGHTHRRKGQNNQDAFAWVYLDESTFEQAEGAADAEPSPSHKTDENTGAFPKHSLGLIAIVCDGCGSCDSSEVGAKLGAQWVMNAVAKRLQEQGDITDHQFWQGVQKDVLGQMRSLTTSLQRSTSNATADWEIIQAYLLFTIMGAVITPETTVVFGLGDGVFAINDDVTSIGPFANNAPPYLAYGLMPEGFTQFSADDLQFTIHCQLPTAEVRSLLIGSDGVDDLRAIANQLLPNKAKPIGDLSQFWQDDRYFKNPDMIRRRLALLNREQTKPDWSNQQLTKTGGLLPDDTTLVVMRRSQPTS